MVIIYSNEFNPATLKLIVAKNFAKVAVDIKIVDPHDQIPQPKHLPCIEIDSDTTLFSSNAALCYLLPPGEDSVEVYNWLEWEAATLSPSLTLLFGTSSKNEKLKSNLLGALNTLEKEFNNKKFLVGNNITNADIAIWSTLYPFLTCPAATKEYITPLSNLSNWFQTLEDNPHFKDAISQFKIELNSSYNALLNGAKYPAPTAEYFHNVEKSSHIEETVTSEEIKLAEKAWQSDISKLPKLKEQKDCVLPVPGERNILITSALPYVNNVPHLGNIIGCVLSADVFARYSRLCNNNTLYIGGTDEYGTATETKALEEGLTCQEICDKYFHIHNEAYKWFNISFNHFGRTTYPEQTEICQEMFLQLNDNGFMFTESVEQLHCENCNRFLADRFVEGGCPNLGCTYEDARGDQCDKCGKLVNAVELKNPKCKICGKTPKLKSSNQFFIDLPKLEPLIHHWIKFSAPGWSNNAQIIAKSWLKEGLKPRCITRDLKWGVPVPIDGFRDKVFYVWFDALIGYLSISKAYTKEFEQWWRPAKGTDVTLYNFMAKDNVPFHAILFPSMLMGTNKGYITVSHIMATEYLNYEDGKFSKSRGVGVFGTDAKSTGIPSDVWRFYLLYVRPESQDSSFSWNDLVIKNNSELLNNLGNFINRALMFVKNNFDKTIPEMNPNNEDYTLLALCTKELKGYIASLEKAKFRDGIRHILNISRHGNHYMQSNQPWVLLKGTDEEKARAGTVIGICCNLSCLLATLLQPYMPDTSDNLKSQMNCSNVVITASNPQIVKLLIAGHKIGEPFPLFAKIEQATADELKKKFAGTQSERAGSENAEIKKLEEEVAKQGDKVRLLKSSGAAKTVWQPEVTILQELKKKLEVAQKTAVVQKKTVQIITMDAEKVKKLEQEVAKQALEVRKLKEGGANKSLWAPEVEKLLALKSRLAEATGSTLKDIQGDKKGKK
ncbi:methionyl-tRNA synthetase 1 [Leptinotarsa decemlineata]|uniref:methionyl-tRNA synthetase 1 n=1 Tax=Leptinotarsa decemlineata TaxID=7539 RepID=UPI003D307CF6